DHCRFSPPSKRKPGRRGIAARRRNRQVIAISRRPSWPCDWCPARKCQAMGSCPGDERRSWQVTAAEAQAHGANARQVTAPERKGAHSPELRLDDNLAFHPAVPFAALFTTRK